MRHALLVTAPVFALVLSLGCSSSKDDTGPTDADADTDTDTDTDTDADADTDTDADTDVTDVTECPDGPLVELRWVDRDPTHSLLPGFVATVQPGVTSLLITDRDGATVFLMAFDALGQATSIDLLAQGGGGVSQDRFTWDDGGNVLTEARYSGVSESDLALVALLTYTYDDEGRRISATSEDAAGAQGPGSTWVWEDGCVVEWTQPSEGAVPRTFTCNAAGHVETMAGEEGQGGQFLLAYGWDADDAPGPIRSDETDPETENPLGSIVYGYTAAGALESKEPSADRPTRIYVYDDDGTLVEEQDVTPEGDEVRARYEVGCD